MTAPSLAAVADYIQQKHNIRNRKVAEQMAQEAIEKDAEQRRFARQREAMQTLTYGAWLKKEFPGMDWESPIYKLIIDHIQAVLDGELSQLIINVPPRLGKSETVTIRLPVFWLLRNPGDGVMIGAYNKDLAATFTDRSLGIYQDISPMTVESTLASEWSTIYGGFVKAAGVGTGIAGRGCELLIVDDPVKNYAEAHSPTYQKAVWNWWLNDLRTRRNRMSHTPTILIMTRWSEDDLTGKILTSPTARTWKVLVVPAIAQEEDSAKDPLGREKGISILEARLPIADLQVTKLEMGRDFDGLYQQDPKGEASYTFKPERIDIVEAVPIEADRVRFFDRAGTEGGGDWTVGVLMAVDDSGIIYIENIVRGQWAPEDVERTIEQTVKLDAHRYAKTKRMMQFWIEQEPAASGKQVAYATVRRLAGYEVFVERPNDNKDVRSRPFAAYVNNGNVKMLKADWNPEFIYELSRYIAFGKREHDDQVDAASGAFSKLTIERMEVESA